jgi:hypothetical protein
MNCFQKLLEFHGLCTFQSNEGAKHGPASNSEIRRWFKQSCIEVNFDIVQADEPWPPIVKSIVLFPKNKKKRTTLFFDDSFSLIQIKE